MTPLSFAIAYFAGLVTGGVITAAWLRKIADQSHADGYVAGFKAATRRPMDGA